MATNDTIGRSARFSTGRLFLLVAAALMTLNHSVLIFVLDEPVLFIGYAAFNLYALLVLALPFRRCEQWAWYATWIFPIGLVIPALITPDIAPIYYSVAAVCVVGLLLTRGDFFAAGHEGGRSSGTPAGHIPARRSK